MLTLFLAVGVFVLIFVVIGYLQNDKIYMMVGASIFVLFAAGMLLLNYGSFVDIDQIVSKL